MMSGEPITPERKPRSRVAVFLGLGIVLGLAAALFLFRSSNKPVTRELLSEARARWEKQGLQDYDLEVQVSGRQGATYEVHVQHGEVTEALRNGAPLRQQRTFRTWSVPGMFDTMETDVDSLEFADANPQNPQRIQLTLRAHFDDKTGLPLTYLRSEWGTHHDVTWKVTRFVAK
jgi:Family of unknown function (DUF6174)